MWISIDNLKIIMIKQAGTIVKLQGAVTEQGALIAVLTTTASTTGHSWIFSFYTSNKRSANDSAKPLTKKRVQRDLQKKRN